MTAAIDPVARSLSVPIREGLASIAYIAIRSVSHRYIAIHSVHSHPRFACLQDQNDDQDATVFKNCDLIFMIGDQDANTVQERRNARYAAVHV